MDYDQNIYKLNDVFVTGEHRVLLIIEYLMDLL